MGQFALRNGFCAKGRKDSTDLPAFDVKRDIADTMGSFRRWLNACVGQLQR